MANLPGGSSDPEIIAASVSRIMNFVFSTTGAGSSRVAAAAMNVLNVVITSLTSAASAGSKPNFGRNAAAANTPPADWSSRRRPAMKCRRIVCLPCAVGVRFRRQVVLDDLSALHHELNVLDLGDVLQLIAIGGDDVGVLALLYGAEVLVLLENRGVDARRHLQHVGGCRAPLRQDDEMLALHPMRALAGGVEDAAGAVADGRRAAAEAEDDAGLHHLHPRLLHLAELAVWRPLDQVRRLVLAQIENRRRDGEAFRHQRLDVVVVRRRAVLDVVDARGDRVFQSGPAA